MKLGRGATWLAVLVLLVGPALLAGAGPAGAAGGVSITVSSLSPAVGTSGSTLQVAGAVTNRGSQVVHKVSIRLRVSQGALGSRSELAAVAAGEVTSRDGTVVVETPLGDLAPGGSEPFDLRQALDDVPALTGFGVYVLGIEVVGTRGAQTGRLAITRTLLPWVPASPGITPTGFSWIWPLVGAPVRLADGTFANDSLAAALAPGGRLDRLLAAGTRLDQEGAAVTWAMDPDLIESVADMADGYRVQTPDGRTVPGGGAGLAQRWLADLRSATEGADALALPYGDVDVAALVRQDMPSDVDHARTAGAAALAAVLPSVSTIDDLAWPADGYLDRAGLATLVRSGVASVVLDGRALPPTIDLSYTPSGRAQVRSGAGPVKALLADPGLADLLGRGARVPGSDGVLAGQRVVAETAMIASELPGGGTPRTIVAMPPRRWDPSQEFLDQVAPVASAPWTAPRSLRALADTPPPEVDRGRLNYPPAERRAELPAAYLKGIAAMQDSISNFAAILTDKTQMVPGLQASVLRLESTYWRGRVESASNRAARDQAYLSGLKRKVYVQGGSFTFGSHSGTIPVTVVNGLPQPVVVDLRLEPQTPRLRLDPVNTRPIGPNQKVQIEVRAHAIAGGPVSVAATLHTPSGAQYGSQVAQLQVNVTQIGTVALVITVGAAAVLFLAAGIRVVRRVRHGTGGGPAPDATDRGTTDTAVTGRTGPAPPVGQAGPTGPTGRTGRTRRRTCTRERPSVSTDQPGQPADAAPDPTSAAAAVPSRERSGALVRTSSVMAAGTAASRALGFVRSAVIVAAIGSAATADSFNTANTIPNIIYILLAGGVLNAVFVPQLVRAMKNDPERSQAYTDRLLSLVFVVLVAVTVVATLCAPLLIWLYTSLGHHDPGSRHIGTLLAYWCLPQIFFYGAYTMLGQVLNARGSFGPMMWAPIVNNLIAITGGLIFIVTFHVNAQNPESLSTGAIVLLGASTTLGVVAQAAVLVPVLRRTGFKFRPRLDVRGSGLGRAGELAKWTLLFVLVNQLAYIVIVNLGNSAGAAAADAHIAYGVGYTPYATAYLIFILPHSIITVSVMTGLLPRMSREAADGDLAAVRRSLSEAWRLTGVGVILCAAALVALAPQLAGVLYASADGAPASAYYIGLVAAAFALGLPAFSAQYIALRGFYAFEDTRTPFYLQIAIAGTNVVLALALYAALPLRWRMVGVAFAYSLTYIGGLALSTSVLRRRTAGLDGTVVVRHYVRLLVAAVPSAALAWLVAWLIGVAAGRGLLASLIALVAGGCVLLVGYVGTARLLHVDELTQLLRRVRRPAGA